MRTFPPGPKGLPLVGNLFDMPKSQAWKTFTKWSEKWGDVISVSVFGQTIVILNSVECVNELLEKRGSVSSDRPCMVVAKKWAGWDRVMVLEDHTSRFRALRRLTSKYMGTRAAIASLSHVLELEASEFVSRVWRNPERLSDEARRNAGATILMLIYGYRIREEEDPMLKMADKAMESWTIISLPGAFLVDLFPSLEYIPVWFPCIQWRETATTARKLLDCLRNEPFEYTRSQMSEGHSLSSFTAQNLIAAKTKEEEELVKDAATALYAGGSDTTVSAVCSLFLAMMCNTEAQAKAHDELDRVIGSGRLPSLRDRDQLPYVNAICLEVLRWNPVAPAGVAHRLSDNVILDDYLLPKDAIIITNIWKLMHDATKYSDPLQFKPERFLQVGGTQPEPDPRNIAFGSGRRVSELLLGMHLADATLFIVCAMSLAVFNITKPIENGAVIEPEIEYTNGTISHPHPFRCSIKPRSERAESLLLSLTVIGERDAEVQGLKRG
ncbi:cytochrome P450 [Wolfiporia cocos MD-104 SS10]|uniref:Cytochrome P450 n=1 Tax=Wolfiporia cocos (strain MD-104) TaxID=742152 RepID=A0A2H3K6V7_WOLCO|nr:cytochrome P450 [Wolfiporia cocos MD-104 SS10]